MKKYTLNIPKRYRGYLKGLIKLKGSMDAVLVYLFQKYHYRIIHLKKLKRGSKALYQPKYEEYVFFSFYMEKDSLWACLEGYRHITKVSMSFLIRLMLEWEMYDESYDKVKVSLEKVRILLREEDMNIPVNKNKTLKELILLTIIDYGEDVFHVEDWSIWVDETA